MRHTASSGPIMRTLSLLQASSNLGINTLEVISFILAVLKRRNLEFNERRSKRDLPRLSLQSFSIVSSDGQTKPGICARRILGLLPCPTSASLLLCFPSWKNFLAHKSWEIYYFPRHPLVENVALQLQTQDHCGVRALPWEPNFSGKVVGRTTALHLPLRGHQLHHILSPASC